jgi:hypothetical protein
MRRMGVNLVRISPDGPQMAEVISRFRGAIDGESSKLAGTANSINGYWHGQAGMSRSDPG